MRSPSASMNRLSERINEAFRPLYGKPCWNVRSGHGSFLTLEFGEPHLEVREPTAADPSRSPAVETLLARRQVVVRGEWHLWIYCCDWQVTADGRRVGGSSSPRGSTPGTANSMEEAAQELDGQALVAMGAGLRRGRWRFDFDLGGRLEIMPSGAASRPSRPADEQWHLHEPSGYVLTVRADGAYCHQPGDTPPSKAACIAAGRSSAVPARAATPAPGAFGRGIPAASAGDESAVRAVSTEQVGASDRATGESRGGEILPAGWRCDCPARRCDRKRQDLP